MRIVRILLLSVASILLLAASSPLFGGSDATAQKKKKAPAKKKSAVLPSDSAAVCKNPAKVGSSYILTYYFTDSLGALIPKSLDDPDIPDDSQYVLKSGITVHKHPNVIVMTHKKGKDTNYISYSPNGDIRIYNTNRKDREWEWLPFGFPVGARLQTDSTNQVVNVLGRELNETISTNAEVMGWDTVGLNGERLACKVIGVKMRIVERKVTTPDVIEGEPFEILTTYWYSPALGFIVRMNFARETRFLNQSILRFNRVL